MHDDAKKFLETEEAKLLVRAAMLGASRADVERTIGVAYMCGRVDEAKRNNAQLDVVIDAALGRRG